MTAPLTERQSLILKYIIQEYVRTGRAVGSKTLIDRYQLGVSPATVRNEMGELEEKAYLQHPHTSAGRIPTDQGYRYYVSNLLDDARMPTNEQIMIRHQFLQVEMQVESWTKLAASILADVSGNLALVTPPRSAVERLRHFELISLRDHVALLIVVSQSGGVHESLLPLSEPVDQADLSSLSQRLNPEVRNLTGPLIEVEAEGASGLAAQVLRAIAEAMHRTEHESQSSVFAEGLDRALQQPEFTQGMVAKRLLELLRGGAILAALLPQLDLDDEVQVFIGSENRSENLRPFGLVVSTYGTSDEITGLLGVLGPTRMAYGRSISTVRYMARVLSDLLSRVYEQGDDFGQPGDRR